MSIVTTVTEVFTQIGEWISAQLVALLPVFYSPTDGLTFLGVLAVMGLGFSVVFLILRVIQNFLNLRS